jgi:hypothetical protein
MPLFDVEMVQPLPQRRTSQNSVDHLGNDTDISLLWLKVPQLLTYIEQLTVYVNDQALLIETLQTQVEEQALQIADLTARVELLEGV